MRTKDAAPVKLDKVRSTIAPELWEGLATVAAEVHADTQPRPDKRAARRHQADRADVNRWRTHGRNSPVHRALVYIEGLAPEEAMRVAGQVLSAARARALGGKSMDELAAIYRRTFAVECEQEAEDRKLEAPGTPWAERSRASIRDGSTDILRGSIEYLFARRGVSEGEIMGGGW